MWLLLCILAIVILLLISSVVVAGQLTDAMACKDIIAVMWCNQH